MTGGRRKSHRGEPWAKSVTEYPEHGGATDRTLRFWRDVWEARRELGRSLRALGTTFAQWRVLYATDQLTREQGEGVSQLDVSVRAGMDQWTISEVMRRLGDKGWVDRAPDGEGFAWRVLVTAAGREILKDAVPTLAHFSLALARVNGDEE